MRELDRMTKHLVKAAGWVCLAMLLVVLEAIVVISHYSHLQVALLLSGADGGPLGLDPLLGPYVGAFIGEATLPNTIALGMAASLGIGAFLIAHLVEKMLFLLQHRDEFRADPTERRLALWSLGQKLFWVLLIASGLFFVGRWDVELFKFRSAAGASGIESSSEASKMKAFSALAKAGPEQSYVHLAEVGAVGLCMLSGLTAFCFAACLSRIEENSTSMMEAIGRWFEGDEGANSPEEGTSVATEDGVSAGGAAGVDSNTSASSGDPQTMPVSDAAPDARAQEEVDAEPGASQPADSSAVAVLEAAAAAPTCRERREVVGEPGTRLTYEEAGRQPQRYRISGEDGAIWSVALWEALHDRGQEDEVGAAEQSKAA